MGYILTELKISASSEYVRLTNFLFRQRIFLIPVHQYWRKGAVTRQHDCGTFYFKVKRPWCFYISPGVFSLSSPFLIFHIWTFYHMFFYFENWHQDLLCLTARADNVTWNRYQTFLSGRTWRVVVAEKHRVMFLLDNCLIWNYGKSVMVERWETETVTEEEKEKRMTKKGLVRR